MAEYTDAEQKKVARLDELVRGNGDDIGLRAQSRINTKDLKVIKSDIRWLVKLLIATFLVGVINIAMNYPW